MGNLFHKNYFWLLACAALVLFSCSSPSFKVLDADAQNGVIMEGQYWRGFFDSKGGFGLRLTNNSGAVLSNCVLSLDDKYKHSIQGLYSQEKGLIKDSTIKKGEQITLRFDDEISNILYFDVQEQNYFPKTVKLEYTSGSVTWKFK
jgi:hypothetical protein